MEFKIRENGFQEIKSAALKKIIPIVIIAAIAGLGINYLNSDWQSTDGIALLIVIPIATGAIVFGLNKGLTRQKVLWDSYKLTVDEKKIVREQHNTPTIFIYNGDIKYITKNPEGAFTVGGDSQKDFIGIPSQIENYEKLEQLLSQIHPITKSSKKHFLEKYVFFLVISVLGLMATVFVSNDKFVVGIAGTILIPILMYSFYEVRRSKNIDNRTKNSSWFIVLPFLAVVVKMFSVLTGLI